MSDVYVAAKDCTILGVDYKAGQTVDVDLPPAYRKDLIEAGLMAPKDSVLARPRAVPSRLAGPPADGAKE